MFFKATPSFNFMRLRIPAFIFSLVVICGGLLGVANGRVKFGIDFTGGVLLEVDLNQASTSEEVRNVIVDFSGAKTQEFGQESHFLIRLPYPEGGEPAIVALKEDLLTTLQGKWEEAKYRRAETVGPKVSDELMSNGLLAMGLAIAAMLVYIWIRFQWRFSVGAVVAITHDVLFLPWVYLWSQEWNLI